MKLKDSGLDKQIEFLKSFSLFTNLSNQELAGLSQVVQEIEMEPGAKLLTQNEPAGAIYFLKFGAVRIVVNGEMVAQIDKPQCFGEMSCLIPNTMASASVVTAKKSQLLRIAKEDFLAAVGQNASIWKMLFLQMSERVKSANGRLSEILTHLSHGLVKVSSLGIVSNDYSIQCTSFFKRESIAGLAFASLAFPDDADKQKLWSDNFDLLFSDSKMSFESCASLLINEFALRDSDGVRQFSLVYSPCKDLDGKINAVDIGIEDVTKQRALELRHKEAKLKEERLAKITQSPDSYLNFLALADEALLDGEVFVADLEARRIEAVKGRVDQLMRQMHSLKGISGVFSLPSFKATVHETEAIVSRVKNLEFDPRNVAAELGHSLVELKIETQRAREVFDEMSGDLRRRLVGIVFSSAEFTQMKSVVELQDWTRAKSLLASIEKIDCKKLLAQWPQEAKSLSESLGKSVRFSVAGEGGRISKDLFSQLDSVLVHLLRNGLDHGLEFPDERAQNGKPTEGRITAMIDVSETEMILAIEDDGRGINREYLAKRARQNSNFDQVLIESFIAKGEEWKILLLPGFSTSKEVTDISGRGVGLDAVASTIQSLGGTLTIESTFGEGTCFLITIPV